MSEQQIPEEVREAGLNYLRSMGPAAEAAGEPQVAETEAAVETQRTINVAEVGATPVKGSVVLVEMDGVMVPQDQVKQMRAEGQDVSIHSSAGRRS